MIIFVGMPASGKSSFAKTYLVPQGLIVLSSSSSLLVLLVLLLVLLVLLLLVLLVLLLLLLLLLLFRMLFVLVFRACRYFPSQFQGYEWVNRDDLKSAEKCLKRTGEVVREGKSVVVDNTNPSVEARSKYIAIAKKNNVCKK
jgi:predicted kinase